jgi:hypothetical protein
MNKYSYLICQEIIKEISFFKNNIIEYNGNFDNSTEILNTVETYEKIDKFTYDTLKLTF